MKDYKLDELIDDGLMTGLTEQAFGELDGRCGGMESGENHSNRRGRNKYYGILAACAAFVLVLVNFNSVMAAARTFITYIVGQGRETGGELNVYEVLEGPVAFESSGSYFVDMAYRKNDMLYFSISCVNDEGGQLIKLEAEIGGKRYACKQMGSYASVSENSETGVRRSREVSEFILEGAPEGRDITLYINGQHTFIELTTPSGYAEDTVKTLDAGWMRASFVPLSPNGQILGYTTQIQDDILKDAYIFFSNTRLISQAGEEVPAEYIGGDDDFSHELVAVNAGETTMKAFYAGQICYRLGGWKDARLGEYKFLVPERGETVNVEENLEIAGIRLHLKSIERSELDHIRLSFERETNRGDLTWLRLAGEGASGYSGGVGKEVTAALTYSYYIVKEGQEDELVRTFPYEAGDEMTVYFEMIEGEMGQEARIEW